jgi:acyl dehydratase
MLPVSSTPSCEFISRIHSLVGANTGGFKGLGAQLFVLVGDQVDAERELIDVRALATEIEDTNLRVWDTTVETRLRVRLQRTK